MEESMAAMAGGDGVRDGITTHAGFPNPAADRGSAQSLSLDRLLIRHPSSTYFFRIEGDNYAEQGIFNGDIALIDRALDPMPADLIICWHDQGFKIAHLNHLTEEDTPWGVVSSIIHQYQRSHENYNEPTNLRPHRLQ
jgi:hypothetical protein